jgi:heme oxygenase (biliverdin-IX-beta and delta-forming)
MKAEAAVRAAELLHRCKAAALGTSHAGAPAVSMVPYAIVDEPFTLVVLVSTLAAHTRDLLADPRVGLMVMEPEGGAAGTHALARVSIQGEARPLPPGNARYDAARAAYVARFPDMAMLFDLADFALVAIEPAAVRAVMGFAQAQSLSPATLAAAASGLRSV